MTTPSSDPDAPAIVTPGVVTTAWPDESDDTTPAVADGDIPAEPSHAV